MRAIIYGAGRATRLGREYAGTPKILLPFGGRSLLEWHVAHLAALGLREVVAVTGYERGQVAAMLPAWRERYAVQIEERFNPDFNEGSAVSMLASLPDILGSPDGVLLMDGDVLYHRSVLGRLIGSSHPTALLIDREYSTVDDDPVLVPLRGGRPCEFQKRWQGSADAVGESVGFFRVGPSDLPLLAEATRARAAGRARLDSYDEIIRALVLAGRFGHEDVTGLPWTEIDFPHDIAHAESAVVPALTGGGPGPRPQPTLAAGGPS